MNMGYYEIKLLIYDNFIEAHEEKARCYKSTSSQIFLCYVHIDSA
jgi:hypothetical protein